MRRFLALGSSALISVLLICCASPAAASGTTTKQVSICKRAPNGRVGCFAIRLDRYSSGRKVHANTALGFGPADVQSAYALPSSSAGAGQTVAIVDAYDDPSAEADLGVYRANFGLPACTARSGCFRKVGQDGTASLPPLDAGWAEEISLDLDMVSAVCPLCHILLVEATSSAQANLGIAVNTAVRLGATAVSNSYGGPDASDKDYGRFYNHPGVAITASSGDDGYGVSYPASSRYVTAVAGTSLRKSGRASRGWTEKAWKGAGSGCSKRNTASWQSTSTTGCSGRAVADVAAVADPATGVAVYDSLAYQDASGWLVFGGTSAAAPIIAATYALAGNTSRVNDASYLWAHHRGAMNDIKSGSNGSCSTDKWCTARSGWDGPTGWGTPKGVAAF